MSISPSSGHFSESGQSNMTGRSRCPAWERTRASQRPYFWPSSQAIPAEVLSRGW